MADIDLSAHRILLVDDVLFARVTVKKILLSFERPEVIEAGDGDEALGIINGTEPPTMVISDFNMPNMNGLELLRAIRCGETECPRDLTVAMLTGYSDEHLVDMALGLDVNAFLIKPISRDTMGTRLGKMLEMTPDSDWLKSEVNYANISIATSEDDVPISDAAPISVKPTRAKPPLIGVAKPTSRLSGKFTEDELVNLSNGPEVTSSGTFGDPDLATRDVMSRLSSLVSRVDDAASAKEIAVGFQRLVAEGDRDVAKRLVTVLDTFEKRGVISSDDLGRVFSPAQTISTAEGRSSSSTAPTRRPTLATEAESFVALGEIEPGTVLARPLHTPDGSVLMADGMVLTPAVLDVLKKLDQLDLLLLEAMADDVSAGRGVFVRAAPEEKPSPARLKSMPLEVAPENAVLGRDVILADGRVYMKSGTILTPRLRSLLSDLIEMERFHGNVWVEVEKPSV